MKITYPYHLPESLKTCAVDLYFSSLQEKLAPILGNDHRVIDLLTNSINEKGSDLYDEKAEPRIDTNEKPFSFPVHIKKATCLCVFVAPCEAFCLFPGFFFLAPWWFGLFDSRVYSCLLVSIRGPFSPVFSSAAICVICGQEVPL
jgi:hypothetical protein